MTQSKPRSGPWELQPVTCKSGRNKLALRASGRHICDISIYDDEDEATARLIAAAPELLEKLAEIRKWMDADVCGPWDERFIADIDALVAKATTGGAA